MLNLGRPKCGWLDFSTPPPPRSNSLSGRLLLLLLRPTNSPISINILLLSSLQTPFYFAIDSFSITHYFVQLTNSVLPALTAPTFCETTQANSPQPDLAASATHYPVYYKTLAHPPVSTSPALDCLSFLCQCAVLKPAPFNSPCSSEISHWSCCQLSRERAQFSFS